MQQFHDHYTILLLSTDGILPVSLSVMISINGRDTVWGSSCAPPKRAGKNRRLENARGLVVVLLDLLDLWALGLGCPWLSSEHQRRRYSSLGNAPSCDWLDRLELLLHCPVGESDSYSAFDLALHVILAPALSVTELSNAIDRSGG